MCQRCQPNERYRPSVGDLLDVDDVMSIIESWNPDLGMVLERWRKWANSQEARAIEAEYTLQKTERELAEADDVAKELRERLTKTDEAITKNVDRCLTLLAKHLGKVQCATAETDELEKILASLRDQYGPKQPTPRR